MSTSKPFTWKGKTLVTFGDIGAALCALESREEAKAFMAVYREHTVYAYQNVGYLAGYYDRETRERIHDWCETAHPFFGRTDPTPEAAFEAGKRLMQEGGGV